MGAGASAGTVVSIASRGSGSRTRGLVAAFCLIVASALHADPAPVLAAPPEPGVEHGHSAAHHAREDLVGLPMEEVERRTNETKARLTRETGVQPGAARSRRTGSMEATVSAAAVPADPGLSGRWGPVIGTPVVPVFQAMLPNGRMLIWDSVSDRATETEQNHTSTRAMVWNPANNTYKRVDVQGYNIFCAGFAHLPNGNVLVAGGNRNANLAGIVQTHVFNWQSETWSRGPDMAYARWYPSVASMANGEQTIVGGGPSTAEVHQNNGTVRSLTGFTNSTYGGRQYPFMISRPDTQLSLFGPYDATFTLTTSQNGTVTGSGARDGKYRQAGSFATFDVGRSLVVGGGRLTEGGVPNVPTRTGVIVNNNSGLVPTVAATGSMSQPRRQFNATVLADGSVLATGGITSGAALVDLAHASTSAERWDPATGAWTVLASASRIRQYHSTASLLPDGRVVTGGGGICGTCMDVGYLEKNVEYFSPPYLYKKDGSGQPAARPVISSAPTTLPVHGRFTVSSPQAAGIRKVALVGLSDVTHGVDQGQRYVPLSFTVSGTTLTVTGPPNGGTTPPGRYMLFLVDAAGVPSVASMVTVARGPNPVMSAVRNTGAAKCLDVPGATPAPRTYVQTWPCHGGKAQALSRLPNDASIRVLGNCLDVPSAQFVPGTRVWTYTCNGSAAQRWQFHGDGTIRPLAKTTLCLAPASTATGAAIGITTCTGGALQKWTW